MAKMTQKQLKRHLQEMPEEALREEILRLYNTIPLVKEYYQLELGEDTNALLNDYKKKIRRYYFPKGRSIKKPKAAKMRELIRNFQRITPFSCDIADLLLYQAECMIDFSAQHGFVSSSFQQTLVSRYKEALLLIDKEMLKLDFQKRCQEILKNTRFMHWGTYEQLLQWYIDIYNRQSESEPA